MSNNTVKSERPKMAIRCMRVACWISKATRARARAQAQAPAPGHPPPHTEICNTYCFTRQQCYVIRTLPVLLLTQEQYLGFPSGSQSGMQQNYHFCTFTLQVSDSIYKCSLSGREHCIRPLCLTPIPNIQNVSQRRRRRIRSSAMLHVG